MRQTPRGTEYLRRYRVTRAYSVLEVVHDLGGQPEEAETGLTVLCRPDLDEPTVIERKHRVVCLTRPYPACLSCKNAEFTLLFKNDRTARFQQVACPRWED